MLTDGFYWRIQPLLAVQQLAFIGCISLWIGPWLRDVGGIADTGQRADIQLYATAATALGFGASGLISGWCRRIGISDFTCAGITSLLFALVCGWLAFLPPSHPLIPWMLFGFLGACPIQYMPVMVSSFPPAYAGRVSTSSNLVVFLVIFAGQWAMGKVVDLWPRTAIGYAPDGYAWAFGALFILQLAGLAWLLAVSGAADGGAVSGGGRLSAATRSRTSWRAATWLMVSEGPPLPRLRSSRVRPFRNSSS